MLSTGISKTKYYIFRSETNYTFQSNAKPAQLTNLHAMVQIFIFLVAAISFSSLKWLKRRIKTITVNTIIKISNLF